MKSVRCSKLELSRRVKDVVNWILEGYSTTAIIDLCTNEWNVADRQGYKYIEYAIDKLNSIPDESLIRKKALHIEQRKKLLGELTKKDTAAGAKTALRILDSIAKIDGSLVEKVDVTSNGEQVNGTVLVLPENGRESK